MYLLTHAAKVLFAVWRIVFVASVHVVAAMKLLHAAVKHQHLVDATLLRLLHHAVATRLQQWLLQQ